MSLLKKLFSNANINTQTQLHLIKQPLGGDGLACIAMLHAHHGIAVGIKELQLAHPEFCQGIGLRQIINILQEHGLETRALQCPTVDLHNIKLPAILHWDMKQFVVLASIEKESFTVLNPATKKTVLTLNEFEQHFAEIVLEVVPKK